MITANLYDVKKKFYMHELVFISCMIINMLLTPVWSLAQEPAAVNAVSTVSTLSATGDAVRIASIFALTGAAVDSNRPSVQGVRHAVRELNDQGGVLGRKIELIEIDNRSTPIGSKIAAEKASRLGVTAIIGCAWSSHSLVVARVAQRDQIPMISNISTHPDVTLTGDWVFRVCYTDIIQGKAMAQFARNTLNARTGVLFVDLNSDYGILLSEKFREYFEGSGGRILDRLEYKSNSDLHHFRGLVSRAEKLTPDVVFIPGYVESALIIREMFRMGLTALPLGGDGWDFTRFFETGGTDLKKGYYCTHWSRQSQSRLSLQYLAGRPDKEAVWAAEVLGADAVNLLAHAMRMAGTTTDRSKIRQSISDVQGFEGITGTISFDKTGDPIKNVVIMEIRNGKEFFHSRFSPE